MSSLPALRQDLDLLKSVIAEAETVALSFFRKDPRVWTKEGNSPVSEADIAVDALLRERFAAARPDYGYLSEESEDDGSRLRARRTFIVDPIDGTRAFIAGATDWTIPVGIVEDGRPVVAVLVAPSRGERYEAIVGEGAFRDGKAIHISARTSLEGATLAVSQRLLRSDPQATPINARTVFHASLAYRLARVADGRLDGVAIKPDAKDWDLAAADLLVHEAGGQLCSVEGESPRYDRQETSHGAMVAGPPEINAELSRIVARVLQHGL